MSSSRVARGVTVAASQDPSPARWAPDELPRLESSRAPAPPPDPATDAGPQEQLRIERASEDGYARGYEQGFRAGEFAESSRLRTAIASLEEGIGSLERESGRWVGNAEDNICALAVTVARHLIARQIELDPHIVTETVRLALAEFPVTEQVRVRLNPGDLQTVTQALQGSGESHSRRAVRWSADTRVAPGGCLIEGAERIVDGRVDAGLERLYRRLSNVGS